MKFPILNFFITKDAQDNGAKQRSDSSQDDIKAGSKLRLTHWRQKLQQKTRKCTQAQLSAAPATTTAKNLHRSVHRLSQRAKRRWQQKKTIKFEAERVELNSEHRSEALKQLIEFNNCVHIEEKRNAI